MRKSGLVARLRNGMYSALTAGAMAFGAYGCEPPTKPENKPITELSVTPTAGISPLEVRLQGSCTDLDGDVKSYRIMKGNSLVTIKNPTDTTFTLNENASYIAECEDMRGNKTTSAPVSVSVTPGEQIAFWSNRDEGTGELYTANLIKTPQGKDTLVNTKRLTNNKVNDVWPAWSPDGESIVFASNREDANSDGLLDTILWTMSGDGTNPARLTPQGVGYASNPVWCKDKIYFNFWGRHWNPSTNTQGIARINPDGTGLEKITEEPFQNQLSERPACSPDGLKIAYVSFIDGNSEIYSANSDGTNKKNLTNDASSQGSPTFSPDGSKLLAISDRDGTLDVYEYILDGNSIPKRLTNGGSNIDPIYSQDGNKILLTKAFQLNLIKSDGTGDPTQLTFDGANRYPAFKPKK